MDSGCDVVLSRYCLWLTDHNQAWLAQSTSAPPPWTQELRHIHDPVHFLELVDVYQVENSPQGGGIHRLHVHCMQIVCKYITGRSK